MLGLGLAFSEISLSVNILKILFFILIIISCLNIFSSPSEYFVTFCPTRYTILMLFVNCDMFKVFHFHIKSYF